MTEQEKARARDRPNSRKGTMLPMVMLLGTIALVALGTFGWQLTADWHRLPELVPVRAQIISVHEKLAPRNPPTVGWDGKPLSQPLARHFEASIRYELNGAVHYATVPVLDDSGSETEIYIDPLNPTLTRAQPRPLFLQVALMWFLVAAIAATMAWLWRRAGR